LAATRRASGLTRTTCGAPRRWFVTARAYLHLSRVMRKCRVTDAPAPQLRGAEDVARRGDDAGVIERLVSVRPLLEHIQAAAGRSTTDYVARVVFDGAATRAGAATLCALLTFWVVCVCVCVCGCVVCAFAVWCPLPRAGNTTVDADAPIPERRRRAAVRSTMVSLRLVANGVVVDSTRPIPLNWPGFTLAPRAQLSLRVRRRPSSLVVAVVHARWYGSATIASVAVPVPGAGAPDHVSAATVGPTEGAFEFASSAPILHGFWANVPRAAAAAAGGAGAAPRTVGSAERFASGLVDIVARWGEVRPLLRWR
jgi:hypothetical protein